MNEYLFKVADCFFSVILPSNQNVARLLPSFHPFWVRGEVPSDFLFCLEVMASPICPLKGTAELLEESLNDLGYVRVLDAKENLQIEVSYDEAREKIHVLKVNRSFTKGKAYILYEDSTAGVALSSMLRMLFAQTIIRKKGISIHASCVSKEGKGYLFLGKSGTGKSTHSEQWMQVFSDCSLLNDDNPVIRLVGDEVRVYGSPWSGKKNCYRTESYPVGGIVRLHQSLINRFYLLEDTLAFTAILPSCSIYRKDHTLQEILYGLLVDIIEQVCVGKLNCLPNNEAAKLCFEKLMNR